MGAVPIVQKTVLPIWCENVDLETLMTLSERDTALKRLESILEQPRDDQNTVAVHLCEIWQDKLWEVADDSFEEFLANEFEMTEADAFMAMKVAACAGAFPEEMVEKINEQIERLP
jgi:hypothetical protein